MSRAPKRAALTASRSRVQMPLLDGAPGGPPPSFSRPLSPPAAAGLFLLIFVGGQAGFASSRSASESQPRRIWVLTGPPRSHRQRLQAGIALALAQQLFLKRSQMINLGLELQLHPRSVRPQRHHPLHGGWAVDLYVTGGVNKAVVGVYFPEPTHLPRARAGREGAVRPPRAPCLALRPPAARPAQRLSLLSVPPAPSGAPCDRRPPPAPWQAQGTTAAAATFCPRRRRAPKLTAVPPHAVPHEPRPPLSCPSRSRRPRRRHRLRRPRRRRRRRPRCCGLAVAALAAAALAAAAATSPSSPPFHHPPFCPPPSPPPALAAAALAAPPSPPPPSLLPPSLGLLPLMPRLSVVYWLSLSFIASLI